MWLRLSSNDDYSNDIPNIFFCKTENIRTARKTTDCIHGSNTIETSVVHIWYAVCELVSAILEVVLLRSWGSVTGVSRPLVGDGKGQRAPSIVCVSGLTSS